MFGNISLGGNNTEVDMIDVATFLEHNKLLEENCTAEGSYLGRKQSIIFNY